jgi:hypothetical protein
MVEPTGWRQRLWRGLTLLMAAAAGFGGAAADDALSPIMALLTAAGFTWRRR